MPQKAEIDDAKRSIETYINRAGESIEDTFGGTIDQTGDPVEGFVVSRGQQRYQVAVSPGLEWGAVRTQVNLPNDIAVHRATQQNGGAVPVDVDDQTVQLAAKSLEQHLQGIDDDVKRDTRLRLTELLSRGDLATDMNYGSTPYHIHGYTTTARLYFYDRDVGFGEYASAVQEVVNAAWAGSVLLSDRYDVDSLIGGGGSGAGGGPSSRPGGSRAFQ